MTPQETLTLDIAVQRKNILYLQEKLEKSVAYKRVVEAEDCLLELKLLCKCEKEYCTITYGSNTGNYDPCNDMYWKDVECHICGKKKSYFDDEEMYNNY